MLTLTCTWCQPQRQRTTHGGQGWSSPRWSPAWWGLLPQTTSDCPPLGWASPEQTLGPYPRRMCTPHDLWHEVQYCLLYIYHIPNNNWLKIMRPSLATHECIDSGSLFSATHLCWWWSMRLHHWSSPCWVLWGRVWPGTGWSGPVRDRGTSSPSPSWRTPPGRECNGQL